MRAKESYNSLVIKVGAILDILVNFQLAYALRFRSIQEVLGDEGDKQHFYFY